MANGSFIAVTPGSGAKLATGPTYTENSNVVQDEKVIFGLPYLATYTVAIALVSTATGASHVMQIMAGASLNVYVMAIKLWQSTAATSATFCEWSVRRLSSAGTGGTVVTPALHDFADAASGAAGMTLPTVKGAEGTVPFRSNGYFTQTPGAAGVAELPVFEFKADENGLYKPIKIGSGTSNGIAVRNDTAVAAATVTGYAVIIESPF